MAASGQRGRKARLTGKGHELASMSALGVRRGKAALSSGCKAHPAIAPAGSNRAAMEVTNWLKPSECVSRIGDSECAGRNASERRAGLEKDNEQANLTH